MKTLQWTCTYSSQGLVFWHLQWKQPTRRKADERKDEAPQPVTKQTLLMKVCSLPATQSPHRFRFCYAVCFFLWEHGGGGGVVLQLTSQLC